MIKMPEIGKCYHIYGESLAEVAIWGVNISGNLLPTLRKGFFLRYSSLCWLLGASVLKKGKGKISRQK
jgi:hypothetical protein